MTKIVLWNRAEINNHEIQRNLDIVFTNQDIVSRAKLFFRKTSEQDIRLDMPLSHKYTW